VGKSQFVGIGVITIGGFSASGQPRLINEKMIIRKRVSTLVIIFMPTNLER
jgi:hypothetical protein